MTSTGSSNASHYLKWGEGDNNFADNTRWLGSSNRGDRYVRKLLIHGARATLRWVGRKTDRRSQWVRGLIERRGKNRAAVALANKNARMAWVLLSSEQVYAL
jgi:transposase